MEKFNDLFSDEEIDAILAALPLVPAFDTCSPVHEHLSFDLCLSVASKLAERTPASLSSLSLNDYRVIAVAVSLAKKTLAGQIHFDISQDMQRKLSQYLSAYDRLDETLSAVIDQHLS